MPKEPLNPRDALTEGRKITKFLQIFEHVVGVIDAAIQAEGKLPRLADNVAQLEAARTEAEANRDKAVVAQEAAEDVHANRVSVLRKALSADVKARNAKFRADKQDLDNKLAVVSNALKAVEKEHKAFKAGAVEERRVLDGQLANLRAQIKSLQAGVAEVRV